MPKKKIKFWKAEKQIAQKKERMTLASERSHGAFNRRDLLAALPPSAVDKLRAEVILQVNREIIQGGEVDIVVPRLLESCVRESAEVRRAVNSMCNSQSVEAHRALRTLQAAHERVQDLRAAFIKQGEIISGMQSASSYAKFRQLHFIEV